MSDTYNSPACQAARDLCIERKGVCGRDCPQALESMRWTCKIREIPEVAASLGRIATAIQQVKEYRPEMITAAKLTREKVWAILDELATGRTGRDIARQFGVHETSVTKIKKGAIWLDVFAAWREQNGKQAG